MKKRIALSLALIICLITHTNVSASSLTCTYTNASPKYTFACTYKYGEKVVCDTVGASTNTLASKTLLGTADFVDAKTGAVSCPKLNITFKMVGKQKREFSYAVDANGTAGVESNRVDDGKEKKDSTESGNEGGVNHNHICHYDVAGLGEKVGLSWVNGKVKAEAVKGLQGYTFKVNGKFTEDMFKDGKCPTAYVDKVTRSKTVIVDTSPIVTKDEEEKKPTGKDDVSTGQDEGLPSGGAPTGGSSGGNDDTTTTDGETGNLGDNFCQELGVKKTLKMIGAFILIAKLAVPLLIVGFGIFDLAKAVIGGDEKSFGSNIKKLIFRVILGAFILFMPTIIDAVLNGLLPAEYTSCSKCLFSIYECSTD